MWDWLGDLATEIQAMRLTIEGAALMATLYPVGVLLALVEVRFLAKVPRTRLRFGIHSRASAFWIALMAVPSVIAIPLLVTSVAHDVPLKGWSVAWVGFAGWVMWSALIPLVTELVFAAAKYDAPVAAQPSSQGERARSPQPSNQRSSKKSRNKKARRR